MRGARLRDAEIDGVLTWTKTHTATTRVQPIEEAVRLAREPPQWLRDVPLAIRIDVLREGEILDSFDADDGLWSVLAGPMSETSAEDELAALLAGDDLNVNALWNVLQRRAVAMNNAPQRRVDGVPTDACQSFTCIGKDTAQCTVALEHPSVSRLHARLVVGVVEEDQRATCGLWLVDNGSSNGTFVPATLMDTAAVPSATAARMPRGGVLKLPPNTPVLVRVAHSTRVLRIWCDAVRAPRTKQQNNAASEMLQPRKCQPSAEESDVTQRDASRQSVRSRDELVSVDRGGIGRTRVVAECDDS